MPTFFDGVYLPEAITPSITWDFYLTVYFSNNVPTSWSVEGANFLKEGHDPFPAYELEVNKKVIYTWDPVPQGNTPAGLGALTGFRVEMQTGGNL